MSSSKTTTDHQEIKRWVEDRGGYPADVTSTHGKGDDPGLLRIGFRDQESLEEISWDDFFDKFEEKHLAFLYQDETSSGDQSRFFKFVDRNKQKH